MRPRLIDVHTHAQFAEFDIDRDAVILRALDAGIWMINVGTDQRMSETAVDSAHKYEVGVFATAGLHPTEIREEFNYDFYKKLAEASKVVAIGECGLDYAVFARERGERLQKRASAEVRDEGGLQQEKIAKQKLVFKAQIKLANEIKKPLMIHCRDAFADLIDILTSNRQLLTASPGVCHFFSGTIEDARKLIDLGFSFSFGGVITFAKEYEKLIKFIPLDRILLETDAPYVAPIPYRGKRNEPAYVEEVAKKIAKILNKNFDEVAKITTQNAIKIFGIG